MPSLIKIVNSLDTVNVAWLFNIKRKAVAKPKNKRTLNLSFKAQWRLSCFFFFVLLLLWKSLLFIRTSVPSVLFLLFSLCSLSFFPEMNWTPTSIKISKSTHRNQSLLIKVSLLSWQPFERPKQWVDLHYAHFCARTLCKCWILSIIHLGLSLCLWGNQSFQFSSFWPLHFKSWNRRK